VAATGVALCCSVWMWPAEPQTPSRSITRLNRVEELLLRAGMPRFPAVAFVALLIVCGVVGGALALALSGVLALGFLGVIAGSTLPLIAVRSRAAKRRAAHRGAWPDTVDHLIASVRSGLGLPDAVAQLAENGPESLRDDFGVFVRRYRATGSFAVAVDEVKERLADPVADRLFETLRMAREVGGTQLVPVLRAFAEHLRESQAVRHEAEARQGWVVNAARLGAVAPWLVLMLLVSRPEAAAAYNTPGGAVVILAGLGVTVLAYRLMLTLGRIPEEGRWFA
jgi:tight adherence protein B